MNKFQVGVLLAVWIATLLLTYGVAVGMVV